MEQNIPLKNIGRFYFKRTVNGNLIGEFSNYAEREIFTECADLTIAKQGKRRTNPFVGHYRSTWNQEDCLLLLKIEPTTRSKKLFTLTWTQKRTVKFEGEAMLCDDTLVGDYHDVVQRR